MSISISSNDRRCVFALFTHAKYVLLNLSHSCFGWYLVNTEAEMLALNPLVAPDVPAFPGLNIRGVSHTGTHYR